MSAERLVASMAASACLASSGWVSITWLPTAGLHRDDAHRVRDDVVQLAGDAQPLLGHGPAGLFLPVALERVRRGPGAPPSRARR